LICDLKADWVGGIIGLKDMWWTMRLVLLYRGGV